jgi:hypothetical protein
MRLNHLLTLTVPPVKHFLQSQSFEMEKYLNASTKRLIQIFSAVGHKALQNSVLINSVMYLGHTKSSEPYILISF